MKRILLIILPFTIISCDPNNTEEKQLNDFVGYYKITSINSETAIDLNNDGIKSKNILEEISSPYTTPSGLAENFYNANSPDNYAEIRPTKQQNNNAQLISFNFPEQIITYRNDDLTLNQPFLMEYSSSMNNMSYEFTNKSEVIIMDNNKEWNSQFGEIKNLTKIDKKTFQINLDKRMFDLSTKKWTVLQLNATYQKI